MKDKKLTERPPEFSEPILFVRTGDRYEIQTGRNVVSPVFNESFCGNDPERSANDDIPQTISHENEGLFGYWNRPNRSEDKRGKKAKNVTRHEKLKCPTCGNSYERPGWYNKHLKTHGGGAEAQPSESNVIRTRFGVLSVADERRSKSTTPQDSEDLFVPKKTKRNKTDNGARRRCSPEKPKSVDWVKITHVKKLVADIMETTRENIHIELQTIDEMIENVLSKLH